jgi:hypothetical protein
MGDSRAWSTNDEKRFIKGIGSFSNIGKPKLELLTKYRKNMTNRKNWHGMDKLEIFHFVDEEIKKEKRK